MAAALALGVAYKSSSSKNYRINEAKHDTCKLSLLINDAWIFDNLRDVFVICWTMLTADLFNSRVTIKCK